MPTRSKRLSTIAFLLFMLAVPHLTLAQAEGTATPTPASGVVYVCIVPVAGDPYLMTLRRSSDMTDGIVGFVVPRSATVTLYSAPTETTGVAVFGIVPDAETGGYQRQGGLVGKVFATSGTAGEERPCSVEYPDQIANSLYRTFPLPVSKDRVVIVQFGGDTLLESAEFLGVFTFHFRPISGQLNEDLQIIQMSGGGIELSFPFIKANTRLIVIANKYVDLLVSDPENTSNFVAKFNSNATEGFSQLLGLEVASTGEQTTLNLFQMMNEGAVRIYPAFGAILSNYPPSSFMRLEMSPLAARRDDLSAGVLIQAIKGLQAQYWILTNLNEPYNTLDNPPGATVEPKPLEVVGIDPKTHDLQVKTAGGTARIESWFVEVVPPQ